MKLKQAIKEVDKRPMTAWMIWGVVKRRGVGYVVVGTEWIRKFGVDKCVHLRKGEAYPEKPVYYGGREPKEFKEKRQPSSSQVVLIKGK